MRHPITVNEYPNDSVDQSEIMCELSCLTTMTSRYLEPEFEVTDVPNSDGSPNTIQVTPVVRGGATYDEEAAFSLIATALQSAVINAIRNYNPRFSEISLGNINGILQMHNIHDYKHAHTEDVNLNTFGVKEIHDIFERVLTMAIFQYSRYHFHFGLIHYH
jgi:hypothetical protein